MLTGSAELFGTELVVGNSYVFTNTKAAIYTWEGCSLEVRGDTTESEYTAQETPMHEYINVHFALDRMRDKAKAGQGPAPRLLILGSDDAGKTTLAKVLTGYALRAERAPVVVNLDVKEGLMSIPGTLTATTFKTLIDVEEGWGTAPMSGPNGTIPVKLPLVYYYGHEDPAHKDGKYYQSQVSRLALAVSGRVSQDTDARDSGVIVDTPGSLSSTKAGSVNADILNHIVSEFSINCIACLGSERLYADIVRRFDKQPVSGSATYLGPAPAISVITLTKSGGCVDRDPAYMTALRAAQTRTYFYGNPKLTNGISLQPRQQQVDFSNLTVWQRIGSFAAGTLNSATATGEADDFLPGDFAPEPSSASGSSSIPMPSGQMFERITAPQAAMRSCVLALMHAKPEAGQEELRDAEVYGFVYVTDVDEARGKISLLSPMVGRVPPAPLAVVWAGWPEGVLGMV